MSGAQPVEVLAGALEQAYAAAHPLTLVADGDSGTDDTCTV